MNYLRGLAAGAALVVGSCSSGEKAESPPKDTSPEIVQHFKPSDAGISEMIVRTRDNPELWAKLSFAAGYFACNRADIIVTDAGDRQYNIEFDFGESFTDGDKLQFAQNLSEILDDYVAQTGDEDYQAWYRVFAAIHGTISGDTTTYCEPIPVGQSETF